MYGYLRTRVQLFEARFIFRARELCGPSQCMHVARPITFWVAAEEKHRSSRCNRKNPIRVIRGSATVVSSFVSTNLICTCTVVLEQLAQNPGKEKMGLKKEFESVVMSTAHQGRFQLS